MRQKFNYKAQLYYMVYSPYDWIPFVGVIVWAWQQRVHR